MANCIQRSERERRELLAAWETSGLSMAAFAAGAGVPLSTFSGWRCRAAGGGREPQSATAAQRRPVAAARPQFVTVKLAAATASHIEVHVGHAVIRVPADFDDAHLARVVRALAAC